MKKHKILTLISEEIFKQTIFPTDYVKKDSADYYLDLDNRYIYNTVVDRLDSRDNCPLFVDRH